MDKRYKQYVKPYAVCLDGRAIVITEPSNDLETLDSERVVIEQYTGLKDKNGKASKVYTTIDLNEFLANSKKEWFCENPFAMNVPIIYNEQ